MQKFNMKRFLKLFIITVFAGVLLYGYTFYSVSTGGAFKAFDGWCRQSQSISTVVGQFQKVKLQPFGYGFVKNKGETGLAGFTVRIIGSTKTINAEVSMTREGNTWKVERVLISGKMLDIK
jgi:hypothetical protein